MKIDSATLNKLALGADRAAGARHRGDAPAFGKLLDGLSSRQPASKSQASAHAGRGEPADRDDARGDKVGAKDADASKKSEADTTQRAADRSDATRDASADAVRDDRDRSAARDARQQHGETNEPRADDSAAIDDAVVAPTASAPPAASATAASSSGGADGASSQPAGPDQQATQGHRPAAVASPGPVVRGGGQPDPPLAPPTASPTESAAAGPVRREGDVDVTRQGKPPVAERPADPRQLPTQPAPERASVDAAPHAERPQNERSAAPSTSTGARLNAQPPADAPIQIDLRGSFGDRGGASAEGGGYAQDQSSNAANRATSTNARADATAVFRPAVSGEAVATPAMEPVPSSAVMNAQSPVPTPTPAASAQASTQGVALSFMPTGAESDADPVTDRAIRGLTSVMAQRGGTVTLRLSPPDLGSLRIDVRLDGATVRAQFQASTPAAASMLHQNMAALRHALESQGLTVDNLQVQAPAATSQAHAGHAGQQTGQQDAQQSPSDGRSRGFAGDGGGDDGSDHAQDSYDQRRRRFEQALLDLVG